MGNFGIHIRFFDFLAAFPSVSHKTMTAVFVAAGAPIGLLNDLELLYSWVNSYISAGGALRFFMRLSSSILQGCSLSRSVFALVSHACFYRVGKAVADPWNAVRCFAGDLGTSLHQGPAAAG